MADTSATPAPAATTPSPPPLAEKKVEHKPVPKGRGFNTKALGLGILAIVLAYFLGLDNLLTIGDNLGDRGVDLTDPTNPWTLPTIEPNMLFMGLVIAIALALFFMGNGGKKIEPIKKKEDHGHGHH